MVPVSTGSILLRRLTPGDLPDFQSYRQDPELGRYQGWIPTPDADARDFLAHMHAAPLLQPATWCQLGIADAATDTLIGDIGLLLSRDQAQAEIGFSLARPWQGRGLATAAVQAAIALVFEYTPAARVIAAVDARNTASIRLLERLGMQRIDSRSARFRGETCVEHVYAMARPAAQP